MAMTGSFTDSNILSAKLTRMNPNYQREVFEEMVLGKWAWSSDGENHDHFIVFKEDSLCSF
jgi:hypothetical protein